jgi:hypothetical protein
MLKYLFITLISFSLGYALYPLVNPPNLSSSDELYLLFKKFLGQEGQQYAQAQSAEEKLKAADRLYEKMLLLLLSELKLEAPENRPILVEVGLQQKPALPIPAKELPAPPKKMANTLPEKILANQLDYKSAMGLFSLPFLSAADSRVVRLIGTFTGKLKPLEESRVGELENISLSVNQDLAKIMTKVESIDTYDNHTLDFNLLTTETFKSVPGDENYLLLMLSSQKMMLLDLRALPTITGRVLNLNKVIGDFVIKKKN